MTKKTLTSILILGMLGLIMVALTCSFGFFAHAVRTGGDRTASMISLIIFSALFIIFLAVLAFFSCYYFRYVMDKKTFDIRGKKDEDITVVSFNLRSTVMNDLFKKGWYYRASLVRRALSDMAPDIVGFQEINTAHEHYLRSHLKGYDFFMAYRTNDLFKEGMLIAYRADRFKREKEGFFWLSETPEKMSKDWNTGSYRVTAYTELVEKKTGKKFVVMDTHLDNASAEARAKGMEVILEQWKKRDLGAMILMGDMNDIEGSPMYLQATSVLIDGQKGATESYTGPGSTWHNFGKELDLEPIDFFFVSPDIRVKKYFVFDKAYGVYPSDHFPIGITITLE